MFLDIQLEYIDTPNQITPTFTNYAMQSSEETDQYFNRKTTPACSLHMMKSEIARVQRSLLQQLEIMVNQTVISRWEWSSSILLVC